MTHRITGLVVAVVTLWLVSLSSLGLAKTKDFSEYLPINWGRKGGEKGGELGQQLAQRYPLSKLLVKAQAPQVRHGDPLSHTFVQMHVLGPQGTWEPRLSLWPKGAKYDVLFEKLFKEKNPDVNPRKISPRQLVWIPVPQKAIETTKPEAQVVAVKQPEFERRENVPATVQPLVVTLSFPQPELLSQAAADVRAIFAPLPPVIDRLTDKLGEALAAALSAQASAEAHRTLAATKTVTPTPTKVRVVTANNNQWVIGVGIIIILIALLTILRRQRKLAENHTEELRKVRTYEDAVRSQVNQALLVLHNYVKEQTDYKQLYEELLAEVDDKCYTHRFRHGRKSPSGAPFEIRAKTPEGEMIITGERKPNGQLEEMNPKAYSVRRHKETAPAEVHTITNSESTIPSDEAAAAVAG